MPPLAGMRPSTWRRPASSTSTPSGGKGGGRQTGPPEGRKQGPSSTSHRDRVSLSSRLSLTHPCHSLSSLSHVPLVVCSDDEEALSCFVSRLKAWEGIAHICLVTSQVPSTTHRYRTQRERQQTQTQRRGSLLFSPAGLSALLTSTAPALPVSCALAALPHPRRRPRPLVHRVPCPQHAAIQGRQQGQLHPGAYARNAQCMQFDLRARAYARNAQ